MVKNGFIKTNIVGVYRLDPVKSELILILEKKYNASVMRVNGEVG